MYWQCKGVRIGARTSQVLVRLLICRRHLLKKSKRALETENITFIGLCLGCWFRLSGPEEEVMKTCVAVSGPTRQRWCLQCAAHLGDHSFQSVLANLSENDAQWFCGTCWGLRAGTATQAVSKSELKGHDSELPMWACLVMDIVNMQSLGDGHC